MHDPQRVLVSVELPRSVGIHDPYGITVFVETTTDENGVPNTDWVYRWKAEIERAMSGLPAAALELMRRAVEAVDEAERIGAERNQLRELLREALRWVPYDGAYRDNHGRVGQCEDFRKQIQQALGDEA